MKNVMNNQMKTPFSKLLLVSLLALLAIGCSKEEKVESIPDVAFVPPSSAQFQGLREIALNDHTETVNFNAENGLSFTSNDGTVLNIPANCLTLNGNLVTGEVELSFVDIFESGDMLPTNKPTMGLNSNGDKAMLITGGEFFIEVTKDGVPLDSGCVLQLLVPGENTGGADPEMILWKGIIDEKGDLTWDEVEPGTHNELFTEGETYIVFLDEFGWTNIDKFYSDPRPKTTLKVKAPEGFNYDNSAVYLSYDGEPNALAQLDTFDEQAGLFSEHYGQIPIGLKVHIIFATAEGDNWRYAIQGVTIAENDVYVFNLEDTQVNTHENMVAAINNLP
ncbi:hypothetical protein [Aequorivita sediminis]|uniref:hypothetical protein n=1 Tax=Aequorivita sediminis TaxID=3073653 RepID=UPI0028ADF15A|nr:hypothetical protein [Aequorivita sp. F6058]